MVKTSFFRRSSPLRRQELAPLVLLFIATGLIAAFAKIVDELLEGDLHDFDHAVLFLLRQPGIRPSRSVRSGCRWPPAM